MSVLVVFLLGNDRIKSRKLGLNSFQVYLRWYLLPNIEHILLWYMGMVPTKSMIDTYLPVHFQSCWTLYRRPPQSVASNDLWRTEPSKIWYFYWLNRAHCLVGCFAVDWSISVENLSTNTDRYIFEANRSLKNDKSKIHTCRSLCAVPFVPLVVALIGMVQVSRKHLFFNIFDWIVGPRTLSKLTFLKSLPNRSISQHTPDLSRCVVVVVIQIDAIHEFAPNRKKNHSNCRRTQRKRETEKETRKSNVSQMNMLISHSKTGMSTWKYKNVLKFGCFFFGRGNWQEIKRKNPCFYF